MRLDHALDLCAARQPDPRHRAFDRPPGDTGLGPLCAKPRPSPFNGEGRPARLLRELLTPFPFEGEGWGEGKEPRHQSISRRHRV